MKPIMGPDVIVGGADIVYDCVGTPSSVEQALRFAATGGERVDRGKHDPDGPFRARFNAGGAVIAMVLVSVTVWPAKVSVCPAERPSSGNGGNTSPAGQIRARTHGRR